METNPDGYIVKTPGVCGGKPRLAGHRIRVQDIVVLHEQRGQSPDDIVSQYPQLSLANVYAALAYDHVHREEIRRDMAEDEAFVEDFKRQHPSCLLPSSQTHPPVIGYHLDEHVPAAIAGGLRRRAIDASTAVEAGLRSATDETHMAYALAQGRVIVTCDRDFLVLASRGRSHASMVYYP